MENYDLKFFNYSDKKIYAIIRQQSKHTRLCMHNTIYALPLLFLSSLFDSRLCLSLFSNVPYLTNHDTQVGYKCLTYFTTMYVSIMLPWLLWNAIMWIEWMSHFYGHEGVVACEFPLCTYSMWSGSTSDVLDGMNIKKSGEMVQMVSDENECVYFIWKQPFLFLLTGSI